MGVAIVISAILILYAFMMWRASSEFQEIGYRKMSIVSVFAGSIFFGIAEVWTIFEFMKLPEKGATAIKYMLVLLAIVVYGILTIYRAISYRTIWKKIVVILMSAIAIAIGYLA